MAKIRGLKKALKRFQNFPLYIEQVLTEHLPVSDYINIKIPVHQALIDGKKTKNRIKKYCCEIVIESLLYLYEKESVKNNKYFAVAIFSFPKLFETEICIFSSKNRFDEFISEERFRYYGKNNEFSKKIGISIDDKIIEQKYAICYLDDDEVFKEKLIWCMYRV